MYNNDNYYEPEDDECDPEDFDAAVEEYAADLLLDECNPVTNWNEGVIEIGLDDSDYPTPTHAPMEIVDKVNAYWYETAIRRATRHYEDNPQYLHD
jgi:hypothetical protein